MGLPAGITACFPRGPSAPWGPSCPRPSSVVSSSGFGPADLPGPRPRRLQGPSSPRSDLTGWTTASRSARPPAGCGDVHDRDLVQARRRRFDGNDRRRLHSRAARHQGDGRSGQGDNKDINYFLGIDAKRRVLAADFEDTINGGNHPAFGVTPIADGVWYHAAATYDGTTWRLYLNGVLEAQVVVGNFTPHFNSIQHAALATALNSTGGAAGAFLGALDEVRIWNVARSATDIQSTMAEPLPAAIGLIGRWGLDEGAGALGQRQQWQRGPRNPSRTAQPGRREHRLSQRRHLQAPTACV